MYSVQGIFQHNVQCKKVCTILDKIWYPIIRITHTPLNLIALSLSLFVVYFHVFMAKSEGFKSLVFKKYLKEKGILIQMKLKNCLCGSMQ
jgi:hypothetical protein